MHRAESRWMEGTQYVSLLLLLCNNCEYCTIAKVEEVLPHHTFLAYAHLHTVHTYVSVVCINVYKHHILYTDIPLVLYTQTPPSSNTVLLPYPMDTIPKLPLYCTRLQFQRRISLAVCSMVVSF